VHVVTVAVADMAAWEREAVYSPLEVVLASVPGLVKGLAA